MQTVYVIIMNKRGSPKIDISITFTGVVYFLRAKSLFTTLQFDKKLAV